MCLRAEVHAVLWGKKMPAANVLDRLNGHHEPIRGLRAIHLNTRTYSFLYIYER